MAGDPAAAELLSQALALPITLVFAGNDGPALWAAITKACS
jgi:hypothetical protein